MEINYRKITEQDIPQLQLLGIKSYCQYVPFMSAEGGAQLEKAVRREGLYENLLEISTGFAATQNEKIIGMAFLVHSGHPPDELYPSEWSVIRMVGVYPEYAGKGIATALTKMCIDEAIAGNEKTIALHTSEIMKAARHIYEKEGFSIVCEIPERFGLRYWLFKKEL